MTHEDVLREMATERYVLGELDAQARDAYEEHLFCCERCAADLRATMTFTDGARAEFAMPASVQMDDGAGERSSEGGVRWWSRLVSPWVMGAALAACLLVLAVQMLVVRPRLERELAMAEGPQFLNSLTLAGGSARGSKAVEVRASKDGAFLLEVDIPAESRFSGYRCSLYSPAGERYWSGDLPSAQAQDTVSLRVPVARTSAGVNALVVEGLVGATGQSVVVARHPFELTVE